MLPVRCSITEDKLQCSNPPEFIVSISVENDEYMVGVTCSKHKKIVGGKIQFLQKEGKIPNGTINFSPLKAVGTDCVHGDEEDFIQLDIKNLKS